MDDFARTDQIYTAEIELRPHQATRQPRSVHTPGKGD